MTEVQLAITIESYQLTFTYGDAETEYFLNEITVIATGKCFTEPFAGRPANLTFLTRNGDEPKPYDEERYMPGAPGNGTVWGQSVLEVQIPLERGAMRSLLAVLKDPREKMLEVVCATLQPNELGNHRAHLKRFSLTTSDQRESRR